MSEYHRITPEEMSALLPGYEVDQDSWKRVKERLITRLTVVGLLYLVRILLFTFFPEYHIYWVDHDSASGQDTMFGIATYRSALLAFLLAAYFYAIYNNAYLRTVATISLAVTFALLWSDLESTMFYPMAEYQWYFVIPFVLRIAVVYLLFNNYLDIRQ